MNVQTYPCIYCYIYTPYPPTPNTLPPYPQHHPRTRLVCMFMYMLVYTYIYINTFTYLLSSMHSVLTFHKAGRGKSARSDDDNSQSEDDTRKQKKKGDISTTYI